MLLARPAHSILNANIARILMPELKEPLAPGEWTDPWAIVYVH